MYHNVNTLLILYEKGNLNRRWAELRGRFCSWTTLDVLLTPGFKISLVHTNDLVPNKLKRLYSLCFIFEWFLQFHFCYHTKLNRVPKVLKVLHRRGFNVKIKIIWELFVLKNACPIISDISILFWSKCYVLVKLYLQIHVFYCVLSVWCNLANNLQRRY